MEELFNQVAEQGATSADRIFQRIEASGLQLDDRRLSLTLAKLAEWGNRPITLVDFKELIAAEALMIKRAFKRQMIIPEWQEFCSEIHSIYQAVAANRDGANADYIPILRDADPEPWGVAICSVDGQRMALGDVDIYHSIQSVSKPITYAYALAREGVEFTH